MNCLPRNPVFGKVLWIALLALILVIGVTIFSINHWSAESVIERKQGYFIKALEKRSAKRLRNVISDNYIDRWEFSKDDYVEAMLDAGGTFIVLVVRQNATETKIDGKQAVVTTNIQVSGNPLGFAGQQVIRTANQLKTPFVFTWEKEGFMPGSWRLVQMENEGIPKQLYGYSPGDIRKALKEF